MTARSVTYLLLTSVFASLAVTLLPLTTFAQEGFVPLVGIPFLETDTPQSLGDYASAFYLAAISLGAVIAVLKIIFAGVKYMLSDIITDKQAAKQDIKGALVGLIIIIGAVLLLNTINPQITSLNALTGIQGLNVPTGGNPNGLQSEFQQICDEIADGGRCNVTSCDLIETDSTIGWLMTDTANRIGCSARCTFLGGRITGRTLLSSGNCVAPDDLQEVVRGRDMQATCGQDPTEFSQCDLCTLGSVELCTRSCEEGRDGIYNVENNACAHNRTQPGVDVADVEPELDEQITGTVVPITGGRAGVDAAIAASGRQVVGEPTGAYPSEEFHYTRRQNIEQCLADGGSTYTVFYGPQSEMFVCYE